jgi:hypothetical protein
VKPEKQNLQKEKLRNINNEVDQPHEWATFSVALWNMSSFEDHSTMPTCSRSKARKALGCTEY